MAKKALCLSGGATRGSFQMGAIKCLYEVYGFRPDIIAGTSVGAINGIKLACSPPPAVNDSATILAAVSGGTIDGQLAHMRALEQFWLAKDGRKDFFMVKPVFIGTMIEELLKEKKETDPLSTPLGTEIDQISALINIPLIHFLAAPFAAVKLQEIKHLYEKINVENAVADLSPVELELRLSTNININNLFNGTPLFMAMVSLETGKLRYATNKGEFFERDGVTPVVTALTDKDIDDTAQDENRQPLAAARKNSLKFVVSKYQAAVNQMAAYRSEINNPNTSTKKKRQLLAAFERERERGNHYSRAAKQQIQGVKVEVKIDPVTAAVGSSSLPGLLESQVVGVERYIDGGLREIIPVEIVLNQNVTQIVGILCSTTELPETDSMENVGLLAVGARAATQIALNEVTLGDLVTADLKEIDTRFISPAIDVHDAMDLKPSLIEISMNYGWLRAADEMHPIAAPDERKIFRQSSELLTRLRLKCLELEGLIQGSKIDEHLSLITWAYFELRVSRWAIMHVSASRTALALPPHPAQATWSTDWEREYRGWPTVWVKLDTLSLGSRVQIDLWPASSPSAFNPDIGTIEDAGSDRIYWMIRGAIFEDKSGAPPVEPLANVIVPSGLHQFLPRIPTGNHLMAETQDQTAVWLVSRGKKYSSPSAGWIAAAGLTGSTVAIVPQGGLSQIPDGGIPYFLSNFCIVDSHDVTLSEVPIERVEQSNTTVDISIHNRSANKLTDILVDPVGFSSAQGISVENAPDNVPPNTIDSFTLRLHPTAAGEFNGSLELNSRGSLFPKVIVELKLKVLPLGDMANLEFTPNPLEINARVNSTSSYSMLTITNTGGITPDHISARIEPAEVQSFFNIGISLSADAFTPGKAIQVPVFFYPTAAGRFNGELVLSVGGNTSTNNPYERTVRIPLVARATMPTLFLADGPQRWISGPGGIRLPVRDLELKVLDFGVAAPIQTSVASFWIRNVGDAPLTVQGVVVDNQGYFGVPDATIFPATLPPTGEMEVPCNFLAPPVPGMTIVGEFRLLSDDPLQPGAVLKVKGRSGGPKLTEPIEFEQGVVVVSPPASTTFTFRSDGTDPVTVREVKLTELNPGTNFSVSSVPQIPETLATGTELTLTVTLTATLPGVYEADLLVAHNGNPRLNSQVRLRGNVPWVLPLDQLPL